MIDLTKPENEGKIIQRVVEVDPLVCPRCGERMRVVAFIEPHQDSGVDRILRHLRL